LLLDPRLPLRLNLVFFQAALAPDVKEEASHILLGAVISRDARLGVAVVEIDLIDLPGRELSDLVETEMKGLANEPGADGREA